MITLLHVYFMKNDWRELVIAPIGTLAVKVIETSFGCSFELNIAYFTLLYVDETSLVELPITFSVVSFKPVDEPWVINTIGHKSWDNANSWVAELFPLIPSSNAGVGKKLIDVAVKFGLNTNKILLDCPLIPFMFEPGFPLVKNLYDTMDLIDVFENILNVDSDWFEITVQPDWTTVDGGVVVEPLAVSKRIAKSPAIELGEGGIWIKEEVVVLEATKFTLFLLECINDCIIDISGYPRSSNCKNIITDTNNGSQGILSQISSST